MITPVWVVGAWLALQIPPPSPPSDSGIELRRERQELRQREAAQLNALADLLISNGDPAGAREVQARIEPKPAPNGPTRFVPLPEVTPASTQGLSNIPAEHAPAVSWRRELQTIRDAQARDLFALAERAAATTPKHYALADECLRAVLDRQPDHPEARRLLGYVPHEGGWATPYAVRKLREGMVYHPVYGWVDGSWVPHLEQGELPAPPVRGQRLPRWLPAAQADELHRPWKSAWIISTEHFEIKTNVPLAEAIAFGRQLEAFNDLFTALLADVVAIGDRLPLAQRFLDRSLVGERTSEPHLVCYFASKQEYVDFLEPIQGPSIATSLGLYVPPEPGKGRRVPAYFFRDPEGAIEAAATLYHEVSHQLLFELAGRSAYKRNVGNYWVFEGLGTYFETVTADPDGTLLVGGLVGPRIEVARHRLIDDHEFIPIERLVQFGKESFSRAEVIHLHYAEAMAVTVFLMQAQDQKYREPFLDYVKDAFRGLLRRDTGRSLEDRLEVPYSTLDDEFLEFLKKG